jgi:hypothetical protein
MQATATSCARSFLMLPMLGSLLSAQTVIVDDSTPSYYNESIDELLNDTSPLFPTYGDPTIDPAPEPDLSPAAGVLGGWKATPPVFGGSWTGPLVAPRSWDIGHEDALVYAIDAPEGLYDVRIEVGVDNGAFLWWDGAYLGGHLMPGGPWLGELTFTIPVVPPGPHHLQILREDHGGATGFTIRVTADVPGATSFGAGCTGSSGTPVLSLAGTPILGSTCAIHADNCPLSPGFTLHLLGLSNETWAGGSLPTPLAAFGMPGCDGLVRPDAAGVAPVVSNRATYPLSIPNQPPLLGMRTYMQAIVFDEGAGNEARAVTSQGMCVVVGRR